MGYEFSLTDSDRLRQAMVITTSERRESVVFVFIIGVGVVFIFKCLF